MLRRCRGAVQLCWHLSSGVISAAWTCPACEGGQACAVELGQAMDQLISWWASAVVYSTDGEGQA